MNPKTKYEEFVENAERRRIFEQESISFEAAELIATLMKKQGVSRASLAERVDTSKAHITQLLSGSRNMTLHTFADLAFALGHRISFKADELKEEKKPIEVVETTSDAKARMRRLPIPHTERDDRRRINSARAR
jgi:transcriptional regulator with XRE-family HTH domain